MMGSRCVWFLPTCAAAFEASMKERPSPDSPKAKARMVGGMEVTVISFGLCGGRCDVVRDR
jgi:hypothetical protein